MKIFTKAIMAGIAVSIGGIVYLSAANQVVGAFLFSIGLFTIYTFGLDLFTGKVCFIPNKNISYLKTIVIVLIGNAVGTVGIGYLVRLTKLSKLIPHSVEIVNNKLSDGLFSTFIMSIFCGIMMSIAVMGFLTIKDSIGKYMAIVLPVMVFILAGFEHSIANLFYYSIADAWSAKAFLYILLVAFGNLVGGTLIPLAKKLMDHEALGCN